MLDRPVRAARTSNLWHHARDLIAAAARELGGPVELVGHSMGAFSAPLACAQVPVERHTLFFHDLPPELAEIMRADDSDAAVEGPAVFDQPWPLAGWPDVPTTVLSGRDDRLFPLDLQRRVSRQRLGLEVEELPGGHLLALSQPSVLAEHLTSHS